MMFEANSDIWDARWRFMLINDFFKTNTRYDILLQNLYFVIEQKCFNNDVLVTDFVYNRIVGQLDV